MPSGWAMAVARWKKDDQQQLIERTQVKSQQARHAMDRMGMASLLGW
jgi:hypothetical protein